MHTSPPYVNIKHKGGSNVIKNEIIIDGELTGTIAEAKSRKRNQGNFEVEFGEEFEPIQQNWRVNPADEADYTHKFGYKDA